MIGGGNALEESLFPYVTANKDRAIRRAWTHSAYLRRRVVYQKFIESAIPKNADQEIESDTQERGVVLAV